MEVLNTVISLLPLLGAIVAGVIWLRRRNAEFARIDAEIAAAVVPPPPGTKYLDELSMSHPLIVGVLRFAGNWVYHPGHPYWQDSRIPYDGRLYFLAKGDREYIPELQAESAGRYQAWLQSNPQMLPVIHEWQSQQQMKAEQALRVLDSFMSTQPSYDPGPPRPGTYAATGRSRTYADDWASRPTYANTGGGATYANTGGGATYANTGGGATYAGSNGTASHRTYPVGSQWQETVVRHPSTGRQNGTRVTYGDAYQGTYSNRGVYTYDPNGATVLAEDA